MMPQYPILVLIATIFCFSIGDNNTNDTFVPTKDWQVVKKGQSIPEGLHVKMNLETKVVEAKLLDKQEVTSAKSLSVLHDENATKATKEHDKIDTGEIKIETVNTITRSMEEALKKLPSDKIEASKNNFKTLDKLKSEFSNMKINVKTDIEVMHELFEKYDKLTKEHPISHHHKEKLDRDLGEHSVEYFNIFVDLEYLVHQYDNANEFIRMKGLENIIYPHLNGTDNALKAEALRVLTACLQNNIKVQIYALETNAGEKLLKILSLESNEYVKARAIRAIGSLVRGYPVAQKYITSKHGMDVFQNILLSNNPNYFIFKIFILTLLDDLVLEHKLVTEFQSSKPETEEKLRQYKEVDLLNKLSNPMFCDILSKVLQEYYEYDKNDVDNINKITTIMTTFVHTCKHHHYKDKKLLATFHKMQALYLQTIKNKSKEVDSDELHDNIELYEELLDFIEKYLNILSDSKLRDEL